MESLKPEELEAVNTQLGIVASICESHLAYMDDTTEPTDDDLGLQILEEAFMFLYQGWLEEMTVVTPTDRILN